jgi:two-component system, chemotaxis family, CheB/CheR fusion protein
VSSIAIISIIFYNVAVAKKKSSEKPPNKPSSLTALTQETGTKSSESSRFPIVGVGASAGGLEAFTQLFKNLPADSGMAFVLIQHMAPTHESLLTELLCKTTPMSVKEVKNGMTVEPDNVYVIPPGNEMIISHGVLHLVPREKTRGQYMPVDSFLSSLAEDWGNGAIAIIMSGTGSDGSIGIRAVKGEGGIVVAQDETAKYDGMPKSAIDTGCVDFVLPPDKIAAELLRIRRHPYLAPVRYGEPAKDIPVEENGLNKIFIMLRSAKGVDFTSYKRSTIMRRVNRRMLLQKIEGMEEYVAYLKGNPSEIETLYQDILINVTSFFREPETFDALKSSVFPYIVKKPAPDIPVRIWVPACSTGEEAYSIAIALIEYMEEKKVSRPVQLFATDIDDIAVEKARRGIYPENISRDVSPERLGRFFEKTGGGYVINKVIREMCIFAKQNMVEDPPFSKIDLISCRNLLIYFGPELQKKAIRILFYALNPRGFLMIGPSETVGKFADLFSAEDKKHTIYAKKAELSRQHFEAPAIDYCKGKAVGKKAEIQPAGVSDIQKEADTLVLAHYSPSGFVVNEAFKILQFRGDTGPYLKPAPGEASLNLLKMVSEDLVAELRTAIHQAKKEDAPVRRERHRVRQDKRIRYINIDVVPFKVHAAGERCFLVLFEEAGRSAQSPAGLKSAAAAKGGSENEEIVRLRQELGGSKELLNTVTQEYEAANEELRALNEELQSSNEEMQSINEEMETAKEELQSTNEELTTVNDELQSRNEEVMQLNNDLLNVLRGIDIPIIILGSELQIKRFNDAAARLLNLIPSDSGRPLSDIRTGIDIPDLEQLVLDVVNTLAVKEKEVRDAEGRWYSLKIRPYRTADNRIDGVLMSLVDISDIKRSLLKVKEAYDYANDIVETVREPLLILDSGMKVITANRSFYENFLVNPEETEGRYIYELGNGQWNIPKLRKQLQEVLPQQKSFSDFEVAAEFPDIGRRTMVLNAREVRTEASHPASASLWESDYDGMILLAIEDISERRKIEDAQWFLVESGWMASGEDFFRSLARYLAESLGMDYVCIDRLEGEGRAARAVAAYLDGKFEDNVICGLKETARGDAEGKTICTFPQGVRDLFPRDVVLRDMKAESYVGATLWSSRGQPIGLIAAISRRPLVDPGLVERMLKMVSVRAAGELERREAEEEIRNLNEHLQRRALELERAYKDMESFTYAASHDLGAPLRIIEGLSHVILEDYADKLDDKGKDLLNRVRNNTEKMSRLITDLLAFSRVSTKEIWKSEFNMEELAQKLVEELNPALGEREVNFEIKQMPSAYGDPFMISQVLVNLLTNAIKFTRTKDTALIEVSGHVEEDENVYFVRDNGMGFDIQLSDKLFGLFQRLHSEKEVGGSGIGLVIVKNIIEKHGGRVWAEGKPDEGATFYFTLPRVRTNPSGSSGSGLHSSHESRT